MNCDVTPEAAHLQEAHVVVIGFGSPIRGDDAIGPLVADRLAEQVADPRVTVISRHVLTAELAAELQRASLLVFVDASASGEPGTVNEQSILPDRAHAANMAHSLNPSGLLALTDAVYGRSPPALLISTPGRSFGYAAYQVTDEIDRTVPTIIQRVLTTIANHLR